MRTLNRSLQGRGARLGLLAVSAFLTGLTVCFPALGALEWVSLIPAALVLFSIAEDGKNRLRSAYLYGLFFFACYFAVTWHWFYVMYPMSYTGLSNLESIAVIAGVIIALPVFQATSFAFSFVITSFLARGTVAKKYPVVIPMSFALLWTAFEWLQTLFWFGVPWGRLAIGQTGLLVTAQTASWFGCYFVTLVLVLVNSLAAYALYKLDRARAFAIAAVAVFSFNLISGCLIMYFPKGNGERVTVAAIQGNLISDEYWRDDQVREVYGRLTREAAEQGANVIVWPETVFINTPLEYSKANQSFISSLADELDVTLLVGTRSTAGVGGQYNAMITVYPDGSYDQDMYFKQYLVPFGEYVPWSELLTALFPVLGEINMLNADWDAGESSTVVNGIGSIICFDSVYEQTVRQSTLNGAELIAIETNDSWFLDSSAIYMHLAQAQLRAIENGRYVVRAANTGVSAVISPNGEIIAGEGALVEGYCTADAERLTELTPYTLFGNLIVWISISTVVFLTATEIVLKRRGGENVDR